MPFPPPNRRQLKTAGNPIGVIDQSENNNYFKRRSLGTASNFGNSYKPISRGGVRTSADNERTRRRPPLGGSRSGVTTSNMQRTGMLGPGAPFRQ